MLTGVVPNQFYPEEVTIVGTREANNPISYTLSYIGDPLGIPVTSFISHSHLSGESWSVAEAKQSEKIKRKQTKKNKNNKTKLKKQNKQTNNPNVGARFTRCFKEFKFF